MANGFDHGLREVLAGENVDEYFFRVQDAVQGDGARFNRYEESYTVFGIRVTIQQPEVEARGQGRRTYREPTRGCL